MKNYMREMTCDEVITRLLEERGLNPRDEKLRSKYPHEVVDRARCGDVEAIIELLKLGPRVGSPVPNRVISDE
jgi:hypothetical protein